MLADPDSTPNRLEKNNQNTLDEDQLNILEIA
jgi:hypothetical protein